MPDEKKIDKRMFYRKAAYFLLAFLAVLSLSTGSTYAYLKWSSEKPVTNTLQAETTVQPVIIETFSDNVKEDVSVSVGDTGYTVYVRTAILANWVNESGQVYGAVPLEGTDYELELYEDGSWFKGSSDGFYYYKNPVESNGSTLPLIKQCRPLKEAPEAGYTLQIKILAQTIQVTGTTDSGDLAAAADAWGMTVK